MVEVSSAVSEGVGTEPKATLSHSLLGGRLHVYKRPESRYWQCSAYQAGHNWRVSTREQTLAEAKQFAEDWYLELRGKHRRGELRHEKTFKEAAVQFEREYEIITEGQRSPRYVQTQEDRLRVHLIPFFGSMGVAPPTPSWRLWDSMVFRSMPSAAVNEVKRPGSQMPLRFPGA